MDGSVQRVEKSACGVLFRAFALFPSRTYGSDGWETLYGSPVWQTDEFVAQVAGLRLKGFSL